MYKFKKAVGCGKTDSSAHKRLPVIFPNVLETLPVASTETKGIGRSYIDNTRTIYGINLENEPVEEIKLQERHEYYIQVPFGAAPPLMPKRNEADRMARMLLSLEEATSHRGLLCGPLRDVSTRYCSFSGGGDIYIERNGKLSACLMTSKHQEEEERGDAVLPKKDGEFRCGSTENKRKTTMSTEAIIIQLQANMLLCAVDQLTKKLTINPGNAEEVKQLTCYGLSVCLQPNPIVLLRLTVDFECGQMKYEELYSSSAGTDSHVYIDCAVEYILRRISL